MSKARALAAGRFRKPTSGNDACPMRRPAGQVTSGRSRPGSGLRSSKEPALTAPVLQKGVKRHLPDGETGHGVAAATPCVYTFAVLLGRWL
jgi:hypothetical protein